jgi:hypothetical protein
VQSRYDGAGVALGKHTGRRRALLLPAVAVQAVEAVGDIWISLPSCILAHQGEG